MKKTLISAILALVPAILVGCASPTDSNDATDDADLRVTTMTSMEVSVGTGFVPPPPPGQCNAHGRYTVDFRAKTLKGAGCIDRHDVAVDRPLSAEELNKVKSAVAAVRTLPRPEACPTDIPGLSLTVNRSTGTTTRYVDELSACFGGANAVDRGTIGNLMKTVESLVSNEQTFEGGLLSVMAIGGETTGTIIRTDEGTFELEFATESDLDSQFVSGRKAKVTGVRVDRAGVEIPMRKFIQVKDMIVCPNSSAVVNCMPPTESRACIPAHRDWISASCEGVSFID